MTEGEYPATFPATLEREVNGQKLEMHCKDKNAADLFRKAQLTSELTAALKNGPGPHAVFLSSNWRAEPVLFPVLSHHQQMDRLLNQLNMPPLKPPPPPKPRH